LGLQELQFSQPENIAVFADAATLVPRCNEGKAPVCDPRVAGKPTALRSAWPEITESSTRSTRR
jgi:hypothetical protein